MLINCFHLKDPQDVDVTLDAVPRVGDVIHFRDELEDVPAQVVRELIWNIASERPELSYVVIHCKAEP